MMGTIMQAVDNPAILSEEQIALIVARVLAALNAMPDDDYRKKALKVREAKLADLRAFEELHQLPRAIPSRREDGHGSKEDGYLHRERIGPIHHQRGTPSDD